MTIFCNLLHQIDRSIYEKNILIFVGCSLLSIHTFASEKNVDAIKENKGNYQLKFGGWSKHFSVRGAAEYDFNENHEGVGFAYSSHYDSEYLLNSFNGYNCEAWYMKDSFDHDNVQVSCGLFYREKITKLGVKNIDFGLNLAAVNRSYADISSDSQLINEKRIKVLLPFPSLSIYTETNLHLDFVFLPAISGISDYGVFFFRAGVDL